MKRHKDLYEGICSEDNIRLAIKQASNSKAYRRDVKLILNNVDYYVNKIREMLINKTFKASEYTIYNIIENYNGKEREIHAPKFYPDQIIHWCLMNKIGNIIYKDSYEYTCGSIPGRGIHHGKRYLERKLKQTKYKYCLKLDIKKYYPSINQNTLLEMMEKRIKDKDTLYLIKEIATSTESGIPIGNYTSQWFANFYLSFLDKFIKEVLKVKVYVRYIDDMVLLSNNKRDLHKFRKRIQEFVKIFSLELKSNYQVFKIKNSGIDFLGFRFFHNKTILRKKLLKRIIRKFVVSGKNLTLKRAYSIISYYGWLKHSDLYNMKKNLLKRVSLKRCKTMVSNSAR